MSDLPRNVGIGFELHVNAASRAFNLLYERMSGLQLNLAERSGVHVTLIDSDEAMFPIRSIRDQAALDEARASGGEYLSEAIGDGFVLTPESPFLATYGHKNRSVGIRIAETDMLEGIRRTLGEIIHDKTGETISTTRPFEPHATIGTKSRQKSVKTGAEFNPQARYGVPRKLHVDGFNITERVEHEPSASSRARQSKYRGNYVYVPRSLRS